MPGQQHTSDDDFPSSVPGQPDYLWTVALRAGTHELGN